jgi:hypothetical protein
MIKSSFDACGVNPNAKIHDKMRRTFEELVSLTSGNMEHCMDVMNSIDKLTEKYRALKLAPNHSSHHVSVAIASLSCNEVVEGNKKVLSPIKVKRKGKPWSKRMVPVIKTVAKKKRKKQVGTFFSPYTYKHVRFPS